MKKRGLSTEKARKVRADGHKDAFEFAKLIGLEEDYKNDAKAKKDVVDGAGDAHSLKSGAKKWQIFLYGLGRFESDEAFETMNGMGQDMIECIKSFPESFDEYNKDKTTSKNNLKPHMISLAKKLQEKRRVKTLFSKSMFNLGEVDYLTIKHEDIYHVFYYKDIIQTFADNLEVTTSKARNSKQFDDQKVIFKYNGVNLAELEMRNDSPVHYREIRFNMLKIRAVNLFLNTIIDKKILKPNLIIYGQAIKRFGKWFKIKSKLN